MRPIFRTGSHMAYQLIHASESFTAVCRRSNEENWNAWHTSNLSIATTLPVITDVQCVHSSFFLKYFFGDKIRETISDLYQNVFYSCIKSDFVYYFHHNRVGLASHRHPHLRFFTLWVTLTCVINRVIIIIIIIRRRTYRFRGIWAQ